LNQAEQALAALAKGVEIVQRKLPQLDSDDLASEWADLLMTHILLREAHALSKQ